MRRRRIVLDTDVLVAAVRSSTGASRALLTAGLTRRFDLIVSTTLMLEYEAVLKRPDIQAATSLSLIDLDGILDAVANTAIRAHIRYRWRPIASDPGDDMVVETAINGSADAIATFNVRDMLRGAGQFGVRVVRPSQLWQEMAP